MDKVGYAFNETEARGILDLVNEKIAGISCQSVRKVRFVFLSYIAAKGKGKVVLGQCVRQTDFDEVQICVRPGWQKTAVHELAHVYNPDVTEERIKVITADVIKYLKMINQRSEAER